MTHANDTSTQTVHRAGELVNLAEFALVRRWTGTEKLDLYVHEIERDADGRWLPGRDPETGEWHLGLEWEEPRDVQQVAVTYAGPVPPDVRVQYWCRNWPTPAPERWSGARRGWIGRDDPWHGRWVTVRGETTVEDNTCTVTFDPVDLVELGRAAGQQLVEAEDYRARFRRTLKVRVVSGGEEQPRVAALHACSGSTWQEGEVLVQFGVDGGEGNWSGRAEAYNGQVLRVEPLGFDRGDGVQADGGWRCHVAGQPKGVRLRLRYARCSLDSTDRTVVTVRTQARSFSFRVDDLARGPIYIRDYGAFIAWADGETDFETHRRRLDRATPPIYDRVEGEPEQSLARALAAIPPLDVTKQAPFGRYVVLGVEAGRQEFGLRYNGELFADKRELKVMGRDTAGLTWPGLELRYRFGSGDPPDFREGRRDGTRQERLEGWLPVFVSRWPDREIEVEQTAFAALLDGPMTAQDARRGDENLVALLRFRLRNTTHGRRQARLWLAIAPQEELTVEDNLVLATGRVVPAEPVQREWRVDLYPERCLRCTVDVAGRGELTAVPYSEEPGTSQATPTAVLYQVALEGGESHAITLAVPFLSLNRPDRWDQVARLDYDGKLADVMAYWRDYVKGGGQIDVPDAILSDFHRAVRTHVAIAVDKDVESGMYVVPAAAWRYGACGNEACWQITMLDQAGHHDRAEAYLETFLRTQGVMGPDGRFTSKEGAFQGLDLDGGRPTWSHFGYNLDHGYIMECLASHYRYTGDRAWLERAIPHLVAACDFVIRERANTQVQGPDGRPAAEWGLLPPGHLEDNPEWRHWFAVNAHAYAGMAAIAGVLTEVEHPEAGRLAQAAADYRADIRAAMRWAMVEAPVAQLLDGSYIPHVPTRTGIRGREWGWFREAAYGPLHLMECGVLDPWEEEVTWILEDLEDNLFVSREWGRPVDLERCWFSHGGVTIQANLMDLGMDYLRRGQVRHALRALFNNFGASLYPDVRVFTEHPVVELGHGVGPFYKTPDESKSLIWLRAFLLREEGERLHLAPGAPRAWYAPEHSFGVQGMASFFGPVTYRMQSDPAQVTLHMDTPDRRPLAELVVHVRRPGREPMQAVTVNGSAHSDFDPEAEVVRIPGPTGRLAVQVNYRA